MRGYARALSAGIVAAGVAAALGLTTAPAAGTARAGAGASGARVPVIVFLKEERPGPGVSRVRSEQRSALIQAARAPVLQQARQLGATDVKSYRLVDAFAASVPATAVRQLTASPGVADVIPDSPITGPDPADLPGPAAAGAGTGGVAGSDPALPGACSAKPQLDPEGLALTDTDSTAAGTPTARSLGYTGAGVKVAFLADGLDPGNVNLQRDGKPVITDYRDFSGDGTAAPTAGGEAFLDANAIAGQGTHVYNVAGFSAQPPAGPCDIRIEGTAPGVSLVALKVFSARNVSSTSGFLQAIDYAVTVDHVNVINESFGSNPFPDVTSLDAVKEFNDMAVADGVTVVVASGDAGPFNTIGSPATDPAVLSVGASTDFRFYAQTDYAAADMFASSGWLDDNISALSSGGYTQAGGTVDMVAPGDLSFASCTANLALYSDCASFLGTPSAVEESGGTSQSAPLVAGAAALVIQAYRKAHGGATPSPAVVKQILLSTAT
ncbi:MAG TPA: S8 family serine peptidase, partial [Trebonia sp.]|nr:S8 family serine peptidase [Trebonia sp.]